MKDFITLQIYESVSQLKLINEEFEVLKYKDSLNNDPEVKNRHEEEMQKPVPKMKVLQIKKP